MSSADVERQDLSMSGGTRTDKSVGSEGIEDPAMERSSHESMESGAPERSGRASSSDIARVNKRFRQRRFERQDRSSDRTKDDPET
jgi:hypothetical protein